MQTTSLALVIVAAVGWNASPDAPRVLPDEYGELAAEYEAALEAFVPPEPFMLEPRQEHPAVVFLPRFEALAAEGEPQASLWILENLRPAGLRSSARRKKAEELLPALFAGGTPAELLPAALEQLEAHYRSIEEEQARQWCKPLLDHASPGVSAGALCALGVALSSNGRTRSEELRAEADALWLRALKVKGGGGASARAAGFLTSALARDHARARRDFERGRVSEDPDAGFLERFRALAEAGAGPAGFWLLDHRELEGLGPEGVRRAGLALIDAHAGEDFLAELAQRLPDWGEELGLAVAAPLGQRLLERVATGPVRAAALLGQAELLAAHGDDAQARDALALLEEQVELVGEEPFAVPPEQQIFQWRNLRVGRVAPDFETEDVDGVAFKLSEYRGKVVLLDFWGFW